MRPLISYYGGKQRLASKILPYFPEHKVYVEPFCGGASLFFAKQPNQASNNDHYREVLNDHDEKLINMYRVFQTRFDEIEHLLKFTLYSRSEHKKSRDILTGKIEADSLWKAWAYFMNIHMSFSNKLLGVWGISKLPTGRNHPLVFSNKTKMLETINERLKQAYIECIDAIECIKKWDTKDTFFYVDPPYPGANQGHYRGYSQEDYNKLIDTLQNIQGKAIVSCYKQDKPQGWDMVAFEAYSSAPMGSNKITGKRTEYIYIKAS